MKGYDSWYDQLIDNTLDGSPGKLRFQGASLPEEAVELAFSKTAFKK